MKKIIASAFAVMLFAAILFGATAQAEPAVTDPTCIYFKAPTDGDSAWGDFNTVYCHISSKSGGDIFERQDEKEKCESAGGGLWKYDLSEIEFDPEGEYSIVFFNDNGSQTSELNITASCLGDIAYCDGEKPRAAARWTHSGDKLYPADSEAVGETKWGTAAGASYDLPENVPDGDVTETQNTTVDVEKLADKQDGINLTAATTWIIIVSAVVGGAIIAFGAVLAKRNKNNDK